MKILITGITGFAGSHLADFILREKFGRLIGIHRWRSDMRNIRHSMDKIELYECDLRDAFSVRDLIDTVRPDRIFHLAAQSFVPTSWKAPTESLTTNIVGQLNIFEAVKKIGINPWIQLACSSEEYGLVYENELPIRETNPLRPLSPYAVSKIGQDMLGYQYFKSFGLKVVRTRGFNHTGPRRAPVFVISDFAKQIVDIENGKREPVMYVGNLEAQRDFTDVRDIVIGYWLSTEKCEPGDVYNICSGKTWYIRDILSKLLSKSKVAIDVRQDAARMRPSDVPVLLGDNTKFVSATGWQRKINFEQTIDDVLNYWRECKE